MAQKKNGKAKPKAGDRVDQRSRWRLDKPGEPVSLADFDPGDKPWSTGNKQQDRERAEQLAIELDELQNLFYADGRYKFLMVLQGLDTSGKDGTLRHVFGRMSPIGVRTVAWKAPTQDERDHDFLWRIHAQVPKTGEVVGYNRSHYEDVLVPVVNGQIDKDETQRRYAQINAFEKLLCETGTVLLKFMLHISKDEQRRRLQARLDDPAKHWKFQESDLKVREQWEAYQQAYGRALSATATPWAPWVIVPADSKTHRNLMIATIVQETLRGLKLRYPPGDPALAAVKVN